MAPAAVTPVTDQPVAVPPTVKSPPERPVTGSLKVTVYVSPAALLGDTVAVVNEATDGPAVSTITDEASDFAPGAVPPKPSVTDAARSEITSVPSVAPAPRVAVTVYGPAPDPLTAVTVQPVAVPPTVKSVAASPVTVPSNSSV